MIETVHYYLRATKPVEPRVLRNAFPDVVSSAEARDRLLLGPGVFRIIIYLWENVILFSKCSHNIYNKVCLHCQQDIKDARHNTLFIIDFTQLTDKFFNIYKKKSVLWPYT